MKNLVINDKKIFYAGLVYFLCIVLYIGVRILWSTGIFNNIDPILSDLLFSTVVQVIILAGLPFILWKMLTKQTFKQTAERFFFKKISFKTVLISLALGFLMYIIVIYASTFWNTLIGLFGYTASSGSTRTNLPVWLAFIITFISTSLMPGFCEETAHRGMLLGNMRNNGLKRAILLSALMFGLAHLNIVQFGHAFVVGLVLATCTFISRSIFPAMIIHGTVNFCSIYNDFSSAYDWIGGGFMENISNFFINSNVFVSLLLALLVLAVVIVLTGILLMRLYVENKRNKFSQFKNNLYKSVKDTEMESMINFNNDYEMLALFNKASANDLKEKVDSGKIPITHLEKELGNNPINTLIYSELEEYKKPHSMDYLFFYMAIAMMTVATIATFIWGTF